MNKTTLALLFLACGIFGFLWLRREAERVTGVGTHVHGSLLLEGLAPERVSAVRVDHLVRSVQLKLERDRTGSWFLTDPVAYPAVDELIRTLLRTLESSTGEPAPGVALDEVGLDPPAVVLEVEQEEAEATRIFRLEIGAVDLDQRKIYVRLPGHPAAPPGRDALVVRAPRTILTTLDRNVDDYREARATHLTANEVSAFRRRGRVFLAETGGEVELELDAVIEPGGWKNTDPPVATLDPGAMGILARGAAEMRVERFLDDSPGDLSYFGLEPPEFEVELIDDRGASTTLLFGRLEGERGTPAESSTWLAMRRGFPHVWQVKTNDVLLLARPKELLYDDRVMRALRDDVTALELVAGERLLALERDEEGWWVSERKVDDEHGEDAGRFPAHPGRVQDALAALEHTQLGEYPPDATFTRQDDATAFTVHTRYGGTWGGEVGIRYRDPQSGAAGHLFRRYGDEVVGLLEDAIAELCHLQLSDFRSDLLHEVAEHEVQRVRLTHGDQEFVYDRREDDWFVAGQTFSAPREFANLLDRLLFVKVAEWLDAPDPTEELSDEVEVVVKGRFGPDISFFLSRTADDGSVVLTRGDGLRARLDSGLHGELLQLFGR